MDKYLPADCQEAYNKMANAPDRVIIKVSFDIEVPTEHFDELAAWDAEDYAKTFIENMEHVDKAIKDDIITDFKAEEY